MTGNIISTSSLNMNGSIMEDLKSKTLSMDSLEKYEELLKLHSLHFFIHNNAKCNVYLIYVFFPLN